MVWVSSIWVEVRAQVLGLGSRPKRFFSSPPQPIAATSRNIGDLRGLALRDPPSQAPAHQKACRSAIISTQLMTVRCGEKTDGFKQ